MSVCKYRRRFLYDYLNSNEFSSRGKWRCKEKGEFHTFFGIFGITLTISPVNIWNVYTFLSNFKSPFSLLISLFCQIWFAFSSDTHLSSTCSNTNVTHKCVCLNIVRSFVKTIECMTLSHTHTQQPAVYSFIFIVFVHVIQVSIATYCFF